MKKVVISLLLIQFAILNGIAQYSQNYDFSVSGEKMQVNVQNKMIAKYQKAESKGKLVATFMKKWCPPNPEKEKIYLGPFNQNLISGKQDIFNCYHWDASNHKIMGVIGGAAYKPINDFLLQGEHDIKILAYSKPKWKAISYASYMTKGLTDEQIAHLIKQFNDNLYNLYSKNSERQIPDLYYKLYDLYYLPKDELKKELSRLHTLGLEEAKSLLIKNFEDAKYYNYYYGKGNPDNYEYSEAVISKGYEAMKNIEEKVAYFNLFYYSSNAKSWQESLLKSATDFYSLLYIYKGIPTNELKEEMESKLSGLANSIDKIQKYKETFPTSSYLSNLDDKAYSLCVNNNKRDPFTYVRMFPNGKHITEANTLIEKIKAEIKAKKEAEKQKRIEKIKDEGPNGVWSVYKEHRDSWFSLWGEYDAYYVEFNDSTQGSYYFDDNKFCLEAGLIGDLHVFYATEKQAQQSLYMYLNTGKMSRDGWLEGEVSDEVKMQNRADNTPVPNYTIKKWEEYENYSLVDWSKGKSAYVYVDDFSIGQIYYSYEKHSYFIDAGSKTYYDTEANAVRALVVYEKQYVLPSIGQVGW